MGDGRAGKKERSSKSHPEYGISCWNKPDTDQLTVWCVYSSYCSLSLKSVSFIMFLENEWIFTRHSTFYGFVWCIYDGAFMSFSQSTFVIYSSINNKYFVRIKLYFMACSLFSLYKQIANHFTFDLCIWDVITKAIHFYSDPTDLKFVDYSVRRDAIVLPHTDSFTRCAHRMLVTQ